MNNKQPMRLSDAELELFKSTFAERDALLLTIRNLFFGLEVTESEKEQVKTTFASPALRKLMRKQFLPEFQPDIPIGQNIDMWMLVDLKGKSTEEIGQEMGATGHKIELIKGALATLENPDILRVNVRECPRDGNFEIYLAGRNLFVNHVDRQLQTISILAGQVSETVEQTKNRLLKDSAK